MELFEKEEENKWGSKSLALNDADAKRRVKPRHGGRVISSGEGLRIIEERNTAKWETKLHKLQKEARVATNALAREEEKENKKEAKKQKKIDAEALKQQKAADKAEKRALKEREAKEKKQAKLNKLQHLIGDKKKPRGRQSTIKVEESTQQEPVEMTASQRPVRIKKPTQRAILILEDSGEDEDSDEDGLIETDSSPDSDSNVDMDSESGGGVDYDDY